MGVGEYGGYVSLTSDGVKISAVEGGIKYNASRRVKRSINGGLYVEPGRLVTACA